MLAKCINLIMQEYNARVSFMNWKKIEFKCFWHLTCISYRRSVISCIRASCSIQWMQLERVKDIWRVMYLVYKVLLCLLLLILKLSTLFGQFILFVGKRQTQKMANHVWKSRLSNARLKLLSLFVVIGSVFQMVQYHF